MTTLANLAKSAPLQGLFDLQQWQANGPITSIGQEQAALLDQIRKYDPNANWRFQDNSGSTNEGGQSAANTYVLDFDQSKLPSAGGSSRYTPFNSAGQAQGIQSLNQGQANENIRLFNDQRTWDSPEYGHLTDSRNVDDRTSLDPLFQYAPMVIGGIAGLAGAGGSLAGLFGGGNSWFNALNGLLQAGSRGSLDGVGVLSRLLPIVGQQFGLPSWGTTLGQLALNGARKGP